MTDEPSKALPSDASAPELLSEANALRRSVAALSRRLRAMRADHGVSGSKLIVLGWLARSHEPLTASRLAALERLQPQSLTRILAELEAGGLIRRRENAADRRELLIEITPQGHGLLAVDARRQNLWLARAIEQELTSEERDLLRIAGRLFDRLIAHEQRTAQELWAAHERSAAQERSPEERRGEAD